MKFILGEKVGMTRVFNDNRKYVPVTLVSAGPCKVLQVKTNDKDGYESVQLGFKKIEKKKNIKMTMKGKEFKNIKEFKRLSPENKAGDDISVAVFKEGEMVNVSGISKGKGFQGGVKRHGFAGRNATHGVKHEQRTIGSTGCRFPQRVIKGRRMPGRMGYERITVKNLEIMKIDAENNLLVLKGAVPGRKGTLLEIINSKL
ncbi:MAG: 50S ribosomal protein L3 [Candidatus Nealsonbacteria bacterium CG23_combo_of_CG06-09_8_20_14_all_39_17]|uniref:Large ribosomal subunit protein uL3 n=1 Tax=Candidatus Nealsonbacteria bacterium CG23_combo_of_CG06-09_8_20_14_all_39_17 TaxID=1974722 RepID=A0A2G9YVZ8_9BACT|nr:MAG: 50S ribosomal protein L3 [Candidatus Nealsonbacteria bacterium CG23_combo_of_CG06-09_8_20_14_all_39_17]PIU43929.1 MAG: 50S ribosomal protein L3 [Candidatus Nealsonbacteria bacterium CG07_land_8_20_14_0_80_39_13]